MRGILVFAWFWDYQISNRDNKNVSEIGKTSALTYKKLADRDRVPLSCNDDFYDDVSGDQESALPGEGYPLGSIFVHPGCTFYGFHDYNYQGM